MFLNPFFALAQSNGVVVNSNNQPLKNVDVFLADQNIVVKTNVDGEFFFDDNLPNNTYINFFKNGYISKLVKYKSDIDFKVILNELHVALDEVGVVESYSELGNSRLTSIEKKSLDQVFTLENSMVESIAQSAELILFLLAWGFKKL